MSIELLKRVLIAPSSPAETVAGPKAWAKLEKKLATALPKDYKEFIAVYGGGRIDEFLGIYSPVSQNKFTNLLERSASDLKAMALLHKEHPKHYKHEVFPAPGGLLSFAATDNGNVLFWVTAGRPESWTVVVYEGRGPDYYSFDGSMTKFLGALLSRSIKCSAFPKDFPSKEKSFEYVPRKKKA